MSSNKPDSGQSTLEARLPPHMAATFKDLGFDVPAIVTASRG